MVKDSSTTVLMLVGALVVAGGAIIYTLNPSETSYNTTPVATANERAREQDKTYLALQGEAVVQDAAGGHTLRYTVRAEAGAELKQEDLGGTNVLIVKNNAVIARVNFVYRGSAPQTLSSYITNTIAVTDPGAQEGGTKNPNRIQWTEVNSPTKQWYVALVKGGEWIVSVEVHRDRLAAMERIIEEFQVIGE